MVGGCKSWCGFLVLIIGVLAGVTNIALSICMMVKIPPFDNAKTAGALLLLNLGGFLLIMISCVTGFLCMLAGDCDHCDHIRTSKAVERSKHMAHELQEVIARA